MTPSVYECRVMHQRLKPGQKRFDYRIFMLSVDLDELPKTRFLGLNRFNLFSLNDRDHINLGVPGGIKANLFAWFKKQGIACPDDARIRLQTLPRVLGYAFNPVSFYYVSSSDGSPLFAVAEVCNTYHEMKLYFIDQATGKGWQKKVCKEFYVSPFSKVNDSFDFNLGFPEERWSVRINTTNEVETTLTSTIHGDAKTLTSGRLLWFAFKYPLLSLKVIFMIHWQALKLWLRKVPYFSKTTDKELQTEVLRPHSSLTQSDD